MLKDKAKPFLSRQILGQHNGSLYRGSAYPCLAWQDMVWYRIASRFKRSVLATSPSTSPPDSVFSCPTSLPSAKIDPLSWTDTGCRASFRERDFIVEDDFARFVAVEEH